MLELTKNMIACSACPRRFRTGDGIYVDPKGHLPGGWVPPRGWAGSAAADHRPIMTVSLNPGHPIPGEMAHFVTVGLRPAKAPGDVTDQAAMALLEYCSQHYDAQPRSRDLVYHKKVIGYVCAAAWLVRQAKPEYDVEPEPAAWRKLAWITDSFKCSTSRDRGPKIPRELMQQCITLHLRKELDAVQPKLVIALGRSAHDALCAGGIAHVRMRHPSNGCPALDSPDHDPGFVEMAVSLGLPPSAATSPSFKTFRRQVQAELFR